MALTPPRGSEESFPGRPVRFLIPFAAAGSNDVVARILAHKLTERWKQQVVCGQSRRRERPDASSEAETRPSIPRSAKRCDGVGVAAGSGHLAPRFYETDEAVFFLQTGRIAWLNETARGSFVDINRRGLYIRAPTIINPKAHP